MPNVSLIKQKESQLARVMVRAAKLQDEINALRKQKRIRATCIRLREVAQMLGVSGTTAIRMIEDRRLKGYRSCPRGWGGVTKCPLQKLHDRGMKSSPVRRSEGTPTPV